MTTERLAWVSLHRLESIEARSLDTCHCGQDLDSCTGHSHCPRCGSSIASPAA